MTTRKIFFKGQVQGVGFRLTMAKKAKELGLTGYVRNNPDGQVESVVSGPSKEIDKLINFLKNRFYISNVNLSETGKCKLNDFIIKN